MCHLHQDLFMYAVVKCGKYSKSIYSKTRPLMKKFYSLLSTYFFMQKYFLFTYTTNAGTYIHIYLHTHTHTHTHTRAHTLKTRAYVYVCVLFSILSYNYNSIADIYANSYFENIIKDVKSYLHVKCHRKHYTLDTLLYLSVLYAFRTISYKYVNIRSQFNISRT